MAMDRLNTALYEITRFLEEHAVPYMIVGGLANMIWGAARLTEDVDISAAIEGDALGSFVESLVKSGYTIPVPDPMAFVHSTNVLPIQTPAGTKIDLILAVLPLEQAAIRRAVRVRFGQAEAFCCTAEDLIILKSVSTRAKDAEDIRGVIARMRGELDLAYLLPILKDLASLLDRPDIDLLHRDLQTNRADP